MPSAPMSSRTSRSPSISRISPPSSRSPCRCDSRAVNVELLYGEATLTATLPDRTRTLSNIEAPTLTPLPALGAAVREALAAPRGLPRIRDLVKPGASVTIAFDDATVASYGPIRSVAIEAVLGELEAAGGPRRDVTLICANA